MKVVSEALGHVSESFTADVYAVVVEEPALKIAAFVPRQNRG